MDCIVRKVTIYHVKGILNLTCEAFLSIQNDNYQMEFTYTINEYFCCKMLFHHCCYCTLLQLGHVHMQL